VFTVSYYKQPCPKAQLTVFVARPNVVEVLYLALPIIVDAATLESGAHVEAPTLRFLLLPGSAFYPSIPIYALD
jgi:hypothetical protein